MPDMMAIVSKAVFEKQAGKAPTVGTRLAIDRYVSANKNLEPLAEGGRLYLVTVRPPDEALWLVAILDQPQHDGEAWVADENQIAMTDISKLRSKIKFESGVGITAKKGALGMSLQTPRALTAEDAELLNAAVGFGADVDAEDQALPPAPDEVVKSSGVRSVNLIDTILADPDNVDAKRVYADLLAQNNDPRGDFILLEIALDGPLSIRKREQLGARHQELLLKHGETWWPYKLATKRTKHGFLRSVVGSFKQLKTAAAAGMFDKEPIFEVSVGLEADEVGKLLKEKWLPRVGRLVVRGEIGDEGFTELVGAKALANLRELNVTNCGVTGEGLGALGTNLPKLTSLVLTSNPIADEGLEGLRQWKHLANIEKLYLSSCEISAEGLGELLSGFTFPKLYKLTLTDNSLEDDIAAVVTKNAARLPALKYLELVRTGIGDSGVKAIGKAKLPALRRIDVRRNDIGGELASKDARIRVE